MSDSLLIRKSQCSLVVRLVPAALTSIIFGFFVDITFLRIFFVALVGAAAHTASYLFILTLELRSNRLCFYLR